jgi:hypothetical protein
MQKYNTKLILDLAERGITVSGHYTTMSAPVRVKCSACQRWWTSTPAKLFKGKGCAKCAAENALH